MTEDIAKDLEPRVGLDLESILELILELMDCFTSEDDMIAAAKSPTMLQKVILGRKIRKDFGYRPRAARRARDEIFAYCTECDDYKLCAAYCECCEALHGRGGLAGDEGEE